MNAFIKTLAATVLLTLSSQAVLAGQATVVDGDTIEINGVSHRLHGIDTPEAGQKCNKAGGGTWRCGDAATGALIAFIEEKVVTCDNRGLDDFQRVISVCVVNGFNLNEAMVRQGYAWAFRKFSDDYVPAEAKAKKARIGIWQAPTQTAMEFRADRWKVAKQVAPNGCPIKGNISGNGRIYHAPWSPWYSKTKISTGKGERWFCSEAEALQAGWRAPYWGN